MRGLFPRYDDAFHPEYDALEERDDEGFGFTREITRCAAVLLYDISDLPMFLAVPHVHLSCVLLLYAGWGNDGTNLHISPRIFSL